MESFPAAPAVMTLSERKQVEAARRHQAADAVVRALCTFARQSGGGFVVFGSYVTGMMRYDSDLNVMIDFQTDRSGDAWRFVEDACAEYGIKSDIRDAVTSRPAFTNGCGHRELPCLDGYLLDGGQRRPCLGVPPFRQRGAPL